MEQAICNMDCFHCKYPDCILDDGDDEESEALEKDIEDERKKEWMLSDNEKLRQKCRREKWYWHGGGKEYMRQYNKSYVRSDEYKERSRLLAKERYERRKADPVEWEKIKAIQRACWHRKHASMTDEEKEAYKAYKREKARERRKRNKACLTDSHLAKDAQTESQLAMTAARSISSGNESDGKRTPEE